MDLFEAADQGKIERIKELIEEGVDVNLQKENGYTALILASLYSNRTSSLEIVKVLLQGQTCLSSQRRSAVQREAGADPNLQEIYRNTALMLASSQSNDKNSLDTVKVLIDAHYDK